MIKIDLITGFLGSGKTTFIKIYASWLMEKGLNIGILENDYGAVNVDMMLLNELRGDNCELEMVAGGCDPDCHRRRFKTKLISMGMCGYDRVLVEPSGIFDVDEFFDVLYEDPLNRWYEIGNVITIVDAKLEQPLSGVSEYFLASEAAKAGIVILSRSQDASSEEIKATVGCLNQALHNAGCSRSLENEILMKDWTKLNEEDYNRIVSCGYVPEDYEKMDFGENDGFQTVYLMNLSLTSSRMETAILNVMRDQACGAVFRIKGFVKEKEGWLELNATKHGMTKNPLKEGQAVIIVIGEALNEECINKYFSDAAEF